MTGMLNGSRVQDKFEEERTAGDARTPRSLGRLNEKMPSAEEAGGRTRSRTPGRAGARATARECARTPTEKGGTGKRNPKNLGWRGPQNTPKTPGTEAGQIGGHAACDVN